MKALKVIGLLALLGVGSAVALGAYRYKNGCCPMTGEPLECSSPCAETSPCSLAEKEPGSAGTRGGREAEIAGGSLEATGKRGSDAAAEVPANK